MRVLKVRNSFGLPYNFKSIRDHVPRKRRNAESGFNGGNRARKAVAGKNDSPCELGLLNGFDRPRTIDARPRRKHKWYRLASGLTKKSTAPDPL